MYMKILLLALTFLASFSLAAQETVSLKRGSDASWKLTLGKKTLLKATAEDPAANVISIKRSDLKKKNTLTLLYSGSNSGWVRTMTVYGIDQTPTDATETELTQQKGSKLVLSSAAVARLAKGHQELKIYTMAVPSDPKVAATVRVRRVHLVTIRII
jgi:hypothetical protein